MRFEFRVLEIEVNVLMCLAWVVWFKEWGLVFK